MTAPARTWLGRVDDLRTLSRHLLDPLGTGSRGQMLRHLSRLLGVVAVAFGLLLFAVAGTPVLGLVVVALGGLYLLVPALDRGRTLRRWAGIFVVLLTIGAVTILGSLTGLADDAAIHLAWLIVFIIFHFQRDSVALRLSLVATALVGWIGLKSGALGGLQVFELDPSLVSVVSVLSVLAAAAMIAFVAGIAVLAASRARNKLVAAMADRDAETQQRVVLQQTAEQQEAIYDAIISNALSIIITATTGGRIIGFNGAAERAFGLSADAAMGKRLKSFLPDVWPEIHDRVRACCAEASVQAVVDGERSGRRADGTQVPLELQALCLAPGGRKLLSIVAFDLTADKEAKRALETAAREIAELSHQAGAAEVAREVLHNVGNVLNSLKTSLAVARQELDRGRWPAIRKVLDLLASAESAQAFVASDPRGAKALAALCRLRGPVDEGLRAASEELGAATKHLEHVEAVVRSQKRMGQGAGVIEEVQLGELVKDSTAHYGDLMLRDEIRLEVQVEDLELRCDRHRVMQILVNLIKNAREALRAHDGERRLTIWAGPEGERAVVRVVDTGIGIEAGILDRIFEHGFTTKCEGSGFGLHASILQAQSMGGSLTASSEGSGKGATFQLSLPRE